ncbi:collagenase [Ferrimonas sp. SCSIO 43195]|uniref:collagenase n=1 Tax=Ferrimonas sp. SCSIO 43195 TaxID=2822844 RepID=UPI0020762BBD|nr:collagenase [Ferrimonas sp. SCSIO 43195]
MMTLRTFTLSLLTLAALSGCATQAPAPDLVDLSLANRGNAEVINDHQLATTIATFSQLVAQPEQHHDALLNQMQYLRAYSYYADIDFIDQPQSDAFHSAMETLGQNLDRTTPALIEQWSVLLYRYYAQNGLGRDLGSLPQSQIRLLAEFEQIDNPSMVQDYALWELIRSAGLLLDSVRRESPECPLKQALLATGLDQALLQFAASDGARRPSGDWPLKNAYWALAQWQLNQPQAQWPQLEQSVTQIAESDVSQRGDAGKDAFTLGFLVNAFYGMEGCTGQFANLCRLPDESEILPIEHRCSDSLFIRTQDLTPRELAQTCNRLTSQESEFHELLATMREPVPGDQNQALKVVVFKNWSQYNAYGQLLYDIATDNGGMYIEGNSQMPGNQATFYAYRAWWLTSEFQVWNLNHEYVHYLDGRYVKYGDFGHFASKQVWWAEGMAEYVSKGHDNDQALTLARDYGSDSWPSLEAIFNTEYHDGLDMTYRWSYLVVRYLCEYDRDGLQQLGQALKSDDFEGYQQGLTTLAAKHQAAYNHWLQGLVDALPQETLPVETMGPTPRKQNRYAYRDYLKPAHLALDDSHLHI